MIYMAAAADQQKPREGVEEEEEREEEDDGVGAREHHRPASNPSVAFTLMVSPSISTAFSLKSTPMVASVLSGKLPPVKRKVRQVFPTLESPMTMILKIRVWMLSSREEVLRSTEDVMLGAASLLLLARLR